MMKMAKGRPPRQGRDIGVVRVTQTGAVWTTKKEATIAANKYGGVPRKVKDGYWARANFDSLGNDNDPVARAIKKAIAGQG